MGDAYLDLSPNSLGIYIPADELLIRTKYQWYTVLPTDDVLRASPIISKYIMASIVDTSDEYHNSKKSEIRSVISI